MLHEQTVNLSIADRARLRPTIDIEALQRFFAATPNAFHRFFFLACVASLSASERQELGVDDSRGSYTDYHFMAGGLLNAALRSKWEQVEPSKYRGA